MAAARGRLPAAPSRQGGYSIVEAFIVFVAISFVVTGAIWAFSKRHSEERRDGVEDEMRAMHEAILAYAMKNRTQGVWVEFVEADSGLTVPPRSNPIYIPSGRPILPCPDLNGDGYEDRYYPQGASSPPDLQSDPVEIEFRFVTAPIAFVFPATAGLVGVNLGATPGRCLDFKGNLPWRTLGVRPADPWGRIFSYRVDSSLTNPVFGFDQTTRASPAFKHLAFPIEDGGYTYAVHYRAAYLPGSSPDPALAGQYSQVRTTYPHSFMALVPAPAWTGAAGASFGDSYVLDLPGVGFQNIGPSLRDAFGSPLAGVPLITDLEGFRQQAEWRTLRGVDGPEQLVYSFRGVEAIIDLGISGSTPELADGIAFSIISHGPNGFGGRLYRPDQGTDDFTCIPFSDFGEGSIAERRNASHTYGCEHSELEEPGTCSQDVDLLITCGEYPIAGLSGTQLVYSGGASTSTGSDTYEFDDIVTWMMPHEIVDELRRRDVLPQPAPPLAVANVYRLTASDI